jgi:hypothetical protein
MRPGYDAERTVVLHGIVQMDANRKDKTERASRCVCINHPILDGPRPPALRLAPLPKRQSSVLVPCDEPIGPSSLFKERGTKWKTAGANNLPSYF